MSSNDGKIETAVTLKDTDALFDGILMNEWIGLIDDKSIYRYLFKWFGDVPRGRLVEIALGLATEKFNLPIEMAPGSLGHCPNSIIWYYAYTTVIFWYNYEDAPGGTITTGCNVGTKTAEHPDSYFVTEETLENLFVLAFVFQPDK